MENAPPPLPIQDTRVIDQEHLRLLTLFHYVLAGITALFACMPVIHMVIGGLLVFSPQTFTSGNEQIESPPAFIGWFFLILGGLFVVTGWTMTVMTYLSGRYLSQRRRRLFSMIIAGIQCTFVPFGTVLGVFTLIVLQRDSVRRLYDHSA